VRASSAFESADIRCLRSASLPSRLVTMPGPARALISDGKSACGTPRPAPPLASSDLKARTGACPRESGGNVSSIVETGNR
jgi:hypothetical protein